MNNPTLPCLCGSIRRTARALTQHYELALRPLGLRATQFTILQVLERAGEVSQGHLGQMLALDSTSLTRTLKIMARQRWISERRGEDRRERWLRLAPDGELLLQRAAPVWEIESEWTARKRERAAGRSRTHLPPSGAERARARQLRPQIPGPDVSVDPGRFRLPCELVEPTSETSAGRYSLHLGVWP